MSRFRAVEARPASKMLECWSFGRADQTTLNAPGPSSETVFGWKSPPRSRGLCTGSCTIFSRRGITGADGLISGTFTIWHDWRKATTWIGRHCRHRCRIKAPAMRSIPSSWPCTISSGPGFRQSVRSARWSVFSTGGASSRRHTPSLARPCAWPAIWRGAHGGFRVPTVWRDLVRLISRAASLARSWRRARKYKPFGELVPLFWNS